MTIRCQECGCYFSRQDFLRYCEPVEINSLYEVGQTLRENLERRSCAYCSSEITVPNVD